MAIAYIIGLGRSGIAAAKCLKQDGWEVILSDRSDSPELRTTQQTLQADGITVKLGHIPTLTPSQLPQLIVVSPGVPWDIPFLIEAREQGIDTIGELELAWRYLKSSPWVGITGTNGKTTTTALVAAIFQGAKLNAPPCGNIGYAACELALSHLQPDNSSPYDRGLTGCPADRNARLGDLIAAFKSCQRPGPVPHPHDTSQRRDTVRRQVTVI